MQYRRPMFSHALYCHLRVVRCRQRFQVAPYGFIATVWHSWAAQWKVPISTRQRDEVMSCSSRPQLPRNGSCIVDEIIVLLKSFSFFGSRGLVSPHHFFLCCLSAISHLSARDWRLRFAFRKQYYARHIGSTCGIVVLPYPVEI